MARGTRGRFWGSIAILCGSAGIAAAEPMSSPLTLWWEPPSGPECPSGDSVLAEVERLLGGKPSTGTNRRLFARAKVSRGQDGAWELTLHTVIAGAGEEAEGERTLHAPSCEELASAAALIVALGFDPAAVAARAGRSADPAPSPGAAADRAPAPPEAARPLAAAQPSAKPPSARPETAAPVRPVLWVSGVLDLGTFASPAYTVQLGAGIRYRRLRLAATAAYFPPLSTTLPERPTAGGRFSLIAVGLIGCGAIVWFRAGSLELAACAGAEGGQMRAEGFGVDSPGSAEALWLAGRLGGALTASFTDAVALRLDLGVSVPIAQNSFYLEDVAIVHKPAYICGRANIGVEIHF